MSKHLLLKLTVSESRPQTWGDRCAGGGRQGTGLMQRMLLSPGAATLAERATGDPMAVLTAESNAEGESTIFKGRAGDRRHMYGCWKTTRQHIYPIQREALIQWGFGQGLVCNWMALPNADRAALGVSLTCISTSAGTQLPSLPFGCPLRALSQCRDTKTQTWVKCGLPSECSALGIVHCTDFCPLPVTQTSWALFIQGWEQWKKHMSHCESFADRHALFSPLFSLFLYKNTAFGQLYHTPALSMQFSLSPDAMAFLEFLTVALGHPPP